MTRRSVLFILLAAAVAFCSSCDLDTASSTRKVVITPDTVVLKIGESKAFTASGGYEYTWHLEAEDIGTLSERSGNTTVYTSLYDPDDSETDTEEQKLYVTSMISGTDHTGGAGSNTNVAYQQRATAYIMHISTNHPSLKQ